MWGLSLQPTYPLLVAGQIESRCAKLAQLLHRMWDLSFQNKDKAHVPCIAREILNH